MFFASKRKKATEAATAGMRPLIAVAQANGGMSTLMYLDPYILGFLFTTAGLFAKAATRGKASYADTGFAIADALSNVSNHNGSEMSSRAADYLESGNEDAVAGNEAALTYFCYSFEMMDHEDEHPVIIAAKEIAPTYLSLGLGSDYRSAVASGILDVTFLAQVKELRKLYGNA